MNIILIKKTDLALRISKNSSSNPFCFQPQLLCFRLQKHFCLYRPLSIHKNRFATLMHRVIQLMRKNDKTRSCDSINMYFGQLCMFSVIVHCSPVLFIRRILTSLVIVGNLSTDVIYAFAYFIIICNLDQQGN